MMIKIVFKWQEEKKDFQCAFNLKCGKEKDRIDKDRRLETKKEFLLWQEWRLNLD